MTLRPLALVVIATVVAVGTLHAEPARPRIDAATRAKAEAHFRQGQAFFQHGDFDRAIVEYQAAYDLSSEPSLIFNIALCHDRANRPEPALQAFQRYLELAPRGAVADEARDDVARLAPIVDAIVADRAAEEARQREPAARPAEPTTALAAKPERLRQPASRVPLYLMVTGGVFAATGATLHVLAWRTREQANRERDPSIFYSEYRTPNREEQVAFAAYVAGAVTIATGLILGHTVFRRDDGPRLSAAITPGGAAMMVGWSR